MVDRLGASFLSLKHMLLGPAVCVQGPTCSLGSDLGRWAHNNSSWFLGSLRLKTLKPSQNNSGAS